MWGIAVNIGKPGGPVKWKWVNDPATGRPFESDLDGALAQIVRWFSTDIRYLLWKHNVELPT
jgi:hypothetical protein